MNPRTGKAAPRYWNWSPRTAISSGALGVGRGVDVEVLAAVEVAVAVAVDVEVAVAVGVPVGTAVEVALGRRAATEIASGVGEGP